MNKHDLLDAVGDIDSKYVKDADKDPVKRSKIVAFQKYYMAAAGLLLLIVAGVIIRNGMTPAIPESEVEEMDSVMTMGAVIEGTEEAAMAYTESIEDMEFNSALISFIEKSGFEDENFMISPTSFRAALALAVAGADHQTKEELLKAMGFSNMDEVVTWYEGVSASSADLQNSIWKNTKSRGKLSRKYEKYVKKNFDATAKNVSANQITDKVNSWINKSTNGLIPQISSDLSYADLVLVNTLYLRTAWLNEFEDYLTEEGEFKTISGDVVKKEFMSQTTRFRYYEDEKGKFVVLPMDGGINAVFILGDVEDVTGKMANASYEQVAVKIPKFETETTFSDNQLIDFCIERGAVQAFNEDADFSLMSKEMSLYISDIIQKTKIKVDETGIEAAAATAVMMTEGCILVEPQEKEFIADEPFKYMIMTDDENPELLFYGQLVE